MAQKAVAVTGASGFIASHLVKLLLEKGYKVHGTVRDLSKEAKVKHLKDLPGADKNLVLFKADLTEPGSFAEAVKGTEVVYHTASPFFFSGVTDGYKQFVEPALKGTENLLTAVQNDPGKTIKTVIVTSSKAAISFDAGKPKDHVYTEADWSDEEHMTKTGLFYHLSKTLAEKYVWKWAEEHGKALGIRTIVINPAMVLGPLLQPEINASAELVLNYLTGKAPEISRGSMGFIDVRDVAEMHLRAAEDPKAEGRYQTLVTQISYEQLVDAIKKIRPDAAVTTKVAEGAPVFNSLFSAKKARDLLGHDFISFEESLKATIESLEQSGFVKKN